MISGFTCNVNDTSTLLGYYAAYNGNSVPAFRGNLLLLSSRFIENGISSSLKM